MSGRRHRPDLSIHARAASSLRCWMAAFAILFVGTFATAWGGEFDATVLTARIDQRLAAAWKAQQVQSVAAADDATFARRVYLDLSGRIPSVAETRTFLEDKSENKRRALVEKLIHSASYARHAALFWRRQWVPQANTPQFALLAEEIDGWLVAQIRDDAPYDRIVRDLITVPRTGTVVADATDRTLAPIAFLTASEFKPENLAANTTRAFLGINLDCAQCHNHPFARWTQQEFWQTAAFFARPKSADDRVLPLRVSIPNTQQTVGPKLLMDPQPEWPEKFQDETGRTILANWVTARSNPYFARNAVNRVWADLFGTGLVEPLDDLSSENPSNHPQLLDDLAAGFAQSGFNLKFLTTAIVQSQAYQLSSVAPPNETPGGAEVFAKSAVRGLTGEQLLDSLRIAAGLPVERDDLDAGNVLKDRKRFAEKFRIERSGTAQRSILQALSLMNGKLTAEFTAIEKTPTLRAVADAPFLDTEEKIESLFLSAFGRRPDAEELAPLIKYVESGGADRDSKRSLADIFWALLNSSEFSTNH